MKRIATSICTLVLAVGLTACDNGAERDADQTATTTETTRTQESPEQTPPDQVGQDEREAEPGMEDQMQAQARIEVSEKEPFGEYLTDADGMSLYMFEADTRGQESTCYDACAQAWPPLTVESADQVMVGEDANEALVDTIERRNGELQVTYAGWPLYYFARDQQPGDTTGQDVEGFGAEWYLMSPAGQVIHEEPQAAN